MSCFNKAWGLLDRKERNRDEGFQMLHEAHASRYHRLRIGDPNNFAIGDWQLSRVYATLKQGELAMLFARSCLDTCEKKALKELLNSAHESVAQACVILMGFEAAKSHLALARRDLELVSDEDYRSLYRHQIDDTEALIGK